MLDLVDALTKDTGFEVFHGKSVLVENMTESRMRDFFRRIKIEECEAQAQNCVYDGNNQRLQTWIHERKHFD